MVDPILYQLPTLSLGSIIGLLIKIPISATILYLSVKLVGGYANFKKAIILSIIMDVLNLLVFPFITNFLGVGGTFLVLFLNIGIWLFLVMKFFGVSLLRAILVAIVQAIVTFVLAILGVIAFLGSIIGAALLLK